MSSYSSDNRQCFRILQSLTINFCVFALILIYLDFKVDLPKNTNAEKIKPVAYLPKVNAEEAVTRNELPKVLIVTQARSGSSFLGSLMSAGPGAYYIFEPYKNIEFKGHRLDDMLDTEDPGAIKLAKYIFKDILECKAFNSTLKWLNKKMKVTKCETATSIVIKAIRLRYSSVVSGILDQ